MDGFKEILGIWVGENESAKFWLGVCNDLKNRGVDDILIYYRGINKNNVSGICKGNLVPAVTKTYSFGGTECRSHQQLCFRIII